MNWKAAEARRRPSLIRIAGQLIGQDCASDCVVEGECDELGSASPRGDRLPDSRSQRVLTRPIASLSDAVIPLIDPTLNAVDTRRLDLCSSTPGGESQSLRLPMRTR